MDWTWIPIVLGTNIITFFTSFYVTKRQNDHADKKFKLDREAKKEDDAKNRRREIRSEPLLRFREELSKAMALVNKVVMGAANKFGLDPLSVDVIEANYTKAADNWNKYSAAGLLIEACYLLANREFGVAVEQIFKELDNCAATVHNIRTLTKEKWGEALEKYRNCVEEMVKLQSKINELLEEL